MHRARELLLLLSAYQAREAPGLPSDPLPTFRKKLRFTEGQFAAPTTQTLHNHFLLCEFQHFTQTQRSKEKIFQSPVRARNWPLGISVTQESLSLVCWKKASSLEGADTLCGLHPGGASPAPFPSSQQWTWALPALRPCLFLSEWVNFG